MNKHEYHVKYTTLPSSCIPCYLWFPLLFALKRNWGVLIPVEKKIELD